MDIQNTGSNGVKIKLYNRDEILIIEAEGILVYQTTQLAKEQMDIDGDYRGYILDLRKTEKIDSTGFGIILNIIKRIPKEKKLVVVVSDEFIKELFVITKVNTLVDIYNNIDEAFSEIVGNQEK